MLRINLHKCSEFRSKYRIARNLFADKQRDSRKRLTETYKAKQTLCYLDC